MRKEITRTLLLFHARSLVECHERFVQIRCECTPIAIRTRVAIEGHDLSRDPRPSNVMNWLWSTIYMGADQNVP